jgi:diadenylate cyclase
MNPLLSTQLGTRHRAGIGITEETDAVSVIVSEETGSISVAVGGQVERDITPERLRQRLAELLTHSAPQPSHSYPVSSTVDIFRLQGEERAVRSSERGERGDQK